MIRKRKAMRATSKIIMPRCYGWLWEDSVENMIRVLDRQLSVNVLTQFFRYTGKVCSKSGKIIYICPQVTSQSCPQTPDRPCHREEKIFWAVRSEVVCAHMRDHLWTATCKCTNLRCFISPKQSSLEVYKAIICHLPLIASLTGT